MYVFSICNLWKLEILTQWLVIFVDKKLFIENTGYKLEGQNIFLTGDRSYNECSSFQIYVLCLLL